MIPAYRESANTLNNLRNLRASAGRILVLLVLNRPDDDTDTTCNNALRNALAKLPLSEQAAQCSSLKELNEDADIFCLDTENSHGPLPKKQGVGLARKIGCDTALLWMANGAIAHNWIHNSDADAIFPANYFEATDGLAAQTAAVHYPFWHIYSKKQSASKTEEATALYELRLHQYVLGLAHAGSPYAFHTLGSCLAVRPKAYAQVRGFPKRAGAEDFYLLNKLAKTGKIQTLDKPTIALESRASTRVPFGTGPAVAQLSANGHLQAAEIFYHPACFSALRVVLNSITEIAKLADLTQSMSSKTSNPITLEQLCNAWGTTLSTELRDASLSALQAMSIEAALAHCQRQSKTKEQFLRQFHQWFDGFRTLKFVHAVRDAGWPNQSINTLQTLEPRLWPPTTEEIGDASIADLRSAVANHWGWTPSR